VWKSLDANRATEKSDRHEAVNISSTEDRGNVSSKRQCRTIRDLFFSTSATKSRRAKIQSQQFPYEEDRLPDRLCPTFGIPSIKRHQATMPMIGAHRAARRNAFHFPDVLLLMRMTD